MTPPNPTETAVQVWIDKKMVRIADLYTSYMYTLYAYTQVRQIERNSFDSVDFFFFSKKIVWVGVNSNYFFPQKGSQWMNETGGQSKSAAVCLQF